jgi:sec-independent protein translocase protein TatA
MPSKSTFTAAALAEVIHWSRFSPLFQGAIMLGRVGMPELLIILVIIILIFGANRLPEIGRGIGRGIRNFKDSTREDPKSDVDRP